MFTSVKKVLNQLIELPSLDNPKIFAPYLKTPLTIADVGSTGGPESHWHALFPITYFYSFDPNPEPLPEKKWEETQFNIGVWSQKTTKPIYLMQFPSASSLFPMDKELDVFMNAPCHKEVGVETLELDTLENLLKENNPPDFIKVDTEGADLEVLKGAESFLLSSVLGVQIEASFIPRHIGAPLFGEIDDYLRKHSFTLFDLSVERWQRKNGLYTYGSKSQAVWGNALYLLSKEALYDRLQALSCELQKEILVKYFLILMAYGLHDYAEEIRKELVHKQLISHKLSDEFSDTLNQRMKKKYLFRLMTGVLIAGAFVLIFYPHRKLRGKAISYFKRVLRAWAHIFSGWAKEGGIFVSM